MKKIILRLKESSYKSLTASTIKRELRDLPLSQRIVILSKLEEQKNRSDNSDVIDVINDIINEFNPKK